MDDTWTPVGRALALRDNPDAATPPTCSPPPSRARMTIPKPIHEMVGGLKARYQHGCADDPEGFQARAALLAQDMADAPPDLMRAAVTAWVRESPFMPTAADLTRLMRVELDRRDQLTRAATDAGGDPAQAMCDQRNAALASDARPGARKDIEWAVVDGVPRIRFKRAAPPAGGSQAGSRADG